MFFENSAIEPILLFFIKSGELRIAIETQCGSIGCVEIIRLDFEIVFVSIGLVLGGLLSD